MEYGPLKSKIDWLRSMNSMFNFLKIFLYTFCRKQMSRRRFFSFAGKRTQVMHSLIQIISYAIINIAILTDRGHDYINFSSRRRIYKY